MIFYLQIALCLFVLLLLSLPGTPSGLWQSLPSPIRHSKRKARISTLFTPLVVHWRERFLIGVVLPLLWPLKAKKTSKKAQQWWWSTNIVKTHIAFVSLCMKFSPQEIASILWAFTKVQQEDDGLFGTVARELMRQTQAVVVGVIGGGSRSYFAISKIFWQDCWPRQQKKVYWTQNSHQNQTPQCSPP